MRLASDRTAASACRACNCRAPPPAPPPRPRSGASTRRHSHGAQTACSAAVADPGAGDVGMGSCRARHGQGYLNGRSDQSPACARVCPLGHRPCMLRRSDAAPADRSVACPCRATCRAGRCGSGRRAAPPIWMTALNPAAEHAAYPASGCRSDRYLGPPPRPRCDADGGRALERACGLRRGPRRTRARRERRRATAAQPASPTERRRRVARARAERANTAQTSASQRRTPMTNPCALALPGLAPSASAS